MTKNKGVALILSVIILTAVLAIALTAGKIFTDKIKMSRNTSDSMKAYYAAESGIEWALYQYKTTGSLPTCNPSCTATVDGAEYEIKIIDGAIKAIGKAGEARRGIEVALAAASGPQELFHFINTFGNDLLDNNALNVLFGKHIVALRCTPGIGREVDDVSDLQIINPEMNLIKAISKNGTILSYYDAFGKRIFEIDPTNNDWREGICSPGAGNFEGEEFWIYGY